MSYGHENGNQLKCALLSMTEGVTAAKAAVSAKGAAQKKQESSSEDSSSDSEDEPPAKVNRKRLPQHQCINVLIMY